jgi:hypothetical protein
MSEEKTEGRKPRIGGIGQQRRPYGTIGGGTRPDAQTSEGSSAETLDNSSTQTSERFNAQASEKRRRQTVYLSPDHDRWIRHRIADSREEISDVINIALTFYREHTGNQ